MTAFAQSSASTDSATSLSCPPFMPARGLANPHLQTVLAVYWRGSHRPYSAQHHHVTLADGDQVVVHDDLPNNWRAEQGAVLLVHGLSGCHLSPYMCRLSDKFCDRGVRVFRLDLRGCGAGTLLARRPYCSGCTDDIRSVLALIETVAPQTPVTLAGFSMGGNIALKLAGESGGDVPRNLAKVMAVCPPVDLCACVTELNRRSNRPYDIHFIRSLWKQIHTRRALVPDAMVPPTTTRPACLFELDDIYTAPAWGYRDALDYYRQCSSGPMVPHITLPTLILASDDDPFIPAHLYTALERPPHVQLHITHGGGHMGFIGRGGRGSGSALDGLARHRVGLGGRLNRGDLLRGSERIEPRLLPLEHLLDLRSPVLGSSDQDPQVATSGGDVGGIMGMSTEYQNLLVWVRRGDLFEQVANCLTGEMWCPGIIGRLTLIGARLTQRRNMRQHHHTAMGGKCGQQRNSQLFGRLVSEPLGANVEVLPWPLWGNRGPFHARQDLRSARSHST